MHSCVFLFDVYSQVFGFLFVCVVECVRCRALERRYPAFYGAGNFEGLPKCVVRLLDVCKFVLPYLVSGFRDVFADEI